MYFTFLDSRKGTGFFMIFIGTLLVDWNHIFELIVSIFLIMIGGLYIFYGFKVGEEAPPPPKGKEDKKDGKEDRKKNYEDKNAPSGEENKGASGNAPVPSYQPREGSIKYQNEPEMPVNKQNPSSSMPPTQPEFKLKPSEAPFNQPMRQSQTPSSGYGAYEGNYGPQDLDEEEYDNQYSNQQPAYNAQRQEPAYNAQRQEPAYNAQRQEPAYDAQRQESAYNAQRQEPNRMQPPPPDEQPMQLPDRLKKFKDINDILF